MFNPSDFSFYYHITSYFGEKHQLDSYQLYPNDHCGLKSYCPGLLPGEENGKCSIAKCRAEFPSVGSHSPEREVTRGGLGDIRNIIFL